MVSRVIEHGESKAFIFALAFIVHCLLKPRRLVVNNAAHNEKLIHSAKGRPYAAKFKFIKSIVFLFLERHQGSFHDVMHSPLVYKWLTYTEAFSVSYAFWVELRDLLPVFGHFSLM